MSNKSKVEEMEDEPKKGQTEESTELNDENTKAETTEEIEEEISEEEKLREDLAKEKKSSLGFLPSLKTTNEEPPKNAWICSRLRDKKSWWHCFLFWTILNVR